MANMGVFNFGSRFIGDFATVKDADGKVIREGTNGWVCLAFNPMPEGGFDTPHDANPACGDAASLCLG